MSDLGALLRKAREQRGYTLDDIQEVTKIRKRYLEAIESGDYKVLPGSFYVRAFVKTYAETVGLDAEEVLRLYHKELPQPATSDSPPAEPMINKARRSAQHSDRWGKVSVTMLMWLFPLLIVGVIYFYLTQNSGQGPEERNGGKITDETGSPTSSASTAPPTLTPSATPSLPASPTPAAVTFTPTGKKGTVNLVDVAPGGAHKLQLDFTGECWLDVNEKSKSGKSLYSKMIKAGDTPLTLSFDMNGPLYVNVGRADNVKITIDGTLFGDGDASNPIRLLFSPVAAP